MRLGVVGNRQWGNEEYQDAATAYALQKLLEDTLDGILQQSVRLGDPIDLVTSGRGTGADTLGEEWAERRCLSTKIHPAQWYDANGKFNRGAGFARNPLIVDDSDRIAAFIMPHLCDLCEGAGMLPRAYAVQCHRTMCHVCRGAGLLATKGTAHTLGLAYNAGIPYTIVIPNGATYTVGRPLHEDMWEAWLRQSRAESGITERAA